MSKLFHKIAGFRRAQEGTASVEFVFLFPIFIFLFLAGFESGYYMVRSAMLDRAVDVAARNVRLSGGSVSDYASFKSDICNNLGIVSECTDNLQIELRPVAIQPGGIAVMNGPVRCVDTNSASDPLTGTTYNSGAVNNLMLVRACLLADPLFPSTGIGAGLKVDSEGNYAIVAQTTWVNEPGNRALAGDYDSGPSVMASYDAGQGNGSDGSDPGNSEGVNHGGDEDSTNPGNGNN